MTRLRAIWTLAAHDLLMWRRMPLAAMCALIPPLGMALLIVVLSLTVTQQPVALVIQSHGQQADRLAKLIKQDDEAYALTVTSRPEADAMLKAQKVAAIITIPPGFDVAATAHNASLSLTLNNVDIDFSDDIRRTVERSVGQYDGLQLGHEGDATTFDKSDEKTPGENPKDDKEDAETNGPTGATADITVPVANAYHIGIEEHDLRVTNVDFLHYQVLPVLILLALSVGLMGSAMLCGADAERGTARLLVLTPVSAWDLVAGRLLGGMLASLAVLAVALTICAITHSIAPPPNHWLALCAILVATAVCASGMGAMLGTMLKGQRNIAMASSILATYLFFLGGGFTTVAFLPRWLREISRVDPIRYAIDGMRQALFYSDLTGVSTDVAVLGGAALAAVLLGSLLVRRSWSR